MREPSQLGHAVPDAMDAGLVRAGLVVVLEHFELGGDGGQRRADLVGGDGGELLQPIHAVGQARHGLVDGVDQGAGLAGTIDGQRGDVVWLASLQGRLDAAERRQGPPCGRERDQEAQHADRQDQRRHPRHQFQRQGATGLARLADRHHRPASDIRRGDVAGQAHRSDGDAQEPVVRQARQFRDPPRGGLMQARIAGQQRAVRAAHGVEDAVVLRQRQGLEGRIGRRDDEDPVLDAEGLGDLHGGADQQLVISPVGRVVGEVPRPAEGDRRAAGEDHGEQHAQLVEDGVAPKPHPSAIQPIAPRGRGPSHSGNSDARRWRRQAIGRRQLHDRLER